MYKHLIVIVALMFMTAGGYYVINAGGGIIGNIIAGNVTTQDTLTPVNIDELPGMYVCATASTCKNTYTLILKSDNSVELIRTKIVNKNSTSTEEENIQESLDEELTLEEELKENTEKGEWEIGIKNMLVLTLTEKGEDTYTVPQKIVIKNIGKKTLSKISYTRSNYEGMTNPIFIKQE